MENYNLYVESLTKEELVTIEGGLEPVEGIIALGAAIYGCGYAFGTFLRHALN